MHAKKKKKSSGIYNLLKFNPLFKTKKYRVKQTGDQARKVSAGDDYDVTIN